MTTGEIIKNLRKSHKMTQEELATKLGFQTKSAICKIEKNQRDVSQSTIAKLSKIFDVSPSYILGFEERAEAPDLSRYGLRPIVKKRLPLLGNIACGEPKYADEDRESYIEAGADIGADFCLRANGDSMINARIHDGDIVFIRSMPQVENGQIAAVIIDDEATLKRVYYYAGKMIVLHAENPKYSDIVYEGADLDKVHILGLAVAFQSDVV